MFGTLKGRLFVIAAVIIASAVTLYFKPLTYGLDLKGGMYLALELKDDSTTARDLRRAQIAQNLEILRNRIDQFGVSEPNVQASGEERIIVELPGMTDEQRARDVIERQAFLEFKLVRDDNSLPDALRRMDRAVAAALGPEGAKELAADQAKDTAKNIQQDVLNQLFNDTTAKDSAAADSAAADPVSKATPLSSLLLQGYRSGDVAVDVTDVEKVKRYLLLPGVLDLLPRGTELNWEPDTLSEGAQLTQHLYLLDEDPFITGDRLKNATAGRDQQFGRTIVEFELDRRGGSEFQKVTSAHIGDRIAIVLDDQVRSAPNVNSAIGARGQIEMGNSPMDEASDLALVLRAGAMSAPLHIVEQRAVGPTMGQDSIDKGKLAGVIGIIGVILIMVLYYRFSGVMAIAALVIYLLMLLAGLALFGAVLTAPGIAGIILSLGMAVDSNVLIFERIREELAAGRTPRVAVDDGFKHAMSAVIDTHLTTLITGMILYKFGTGPVQGFAVTLSVGILASFFSAIYITRTFYLWYLDRRGSADPISI
jgi:preprotein translocase subunit SecD